MRINIELEQEEDGRWIGEAVDFPGVLVYGSTHAEATRLAKALALRVVAERLEQSEVSPAFSNIFFNEPLTHAAVAVS